MATIGSLAVKLIANTASFVKGIETSKAQLQDLATTTTHYGAESKAAFGQTVSAAGKSSTSLGDMETAISRLNQDVTALGNKPVKSLGTLNTAADAAGQQFSKTGRLSKDALAGLLGLLDKTQAEWKRGGNAASLAFGEARKALGALAAAQREAAKADEQDAKERAARWSALKVSALAFGAAATYGIVRLVKSSIDSTAELSKLARELDATTEGITSLQFAARRLGADDGAVTSGLISLRQALTDAQFGSVAARDTFDRLGVSWQRLQNLPADSAFFKVASRLAAIPDPTKRAALAVQIFGDDARKLLPLLQTGAQGLAEFAARAKDMGLAVSSVDAERVEQARISMSAINETLTSLGNTIAVAVAPVLQELADRLVDMGKEGVVSGDKVSGGMRSIAQTGSQVLNVIKGIWIAFRFVELGATAVVFAWFKLVKAIIDTGAKLPGEIGKAFRDAQANAAAIPDAILDRMRTIKAEIKDLQASGFIKASSVDDFFDAVKKRQDEIARKANEIRGKGGAAPLTGRGGPAGAFSETKSIVQQSLTPLQAANEQFAKLNQLAASGAISWDVYSRSIGKAVAGLESAYQLQASKLPTAVERNTTAAYSVAVQAEQEADLRLREKPEERVARILQEALISDKLRERYMQQIAEALKKRPKEASL